MRRVIPTVGLALVLCGAISCAHAKTGISPEEAVIALLRYRLGEQDALPGYTVGAIDGSVTSVSASLSSPSPLDNFRVNQNAGLVVSFRQVIAPAAPCGRYFRRFREVRRGTVGEL